MPPVVPLEPLEGVEDQRLVVGAGANRRSYSTSCCDEGIATSTKKLINIRETGYLLLHPGDFAIVIVLEEIRLGPQYAGRFGLRSRYARKGLVATTGPQVDPGYHGRLIVGLTSLTPNPISLPYKDDFVSLELHRLEEPTTKPYTGAYQGRVHLGPEEIEAVTEGTGMALSEVLTTLSSVSQNVGNLSTTVAALTGEVKTLRWLLPLVTGVGIAVVAAIVALKPS